MQLFYDPDLHPGSHDLREVEARHAIRVLRKQEGDTLTLVDGKGGWFSGLITYADKRRCTIEAKSIKQEDQRANHRLTLWVAPTKQIDRFEWILEKATEIGIDIIQPIISAHSERTRLRQDRLEKVLESAMKQSLRAFLPELRPLSSFSELLQVSSDDDIRCLAYLGEENTGLLTNNYKRGQNVTIAIGPEGGFNKEEAQSAQEAGFHLVSLGPHRLRTETAAITAVHTIEQINW